MKRNDSSFFRAAVVSFAHFSRSSYQSHQLSQYFQSCQRSGTVGAMDGALLSSEEGLENADTVVGGSEPWTAVSGAVVWYEAV